MTPRKVEVIALDDFPFISPGDDIASIILERSHGAGLHNGDIVVIAQKIISKAENRYRNLNKINPSKEAIRLAAKTEKNPSLVELILQESAEIVRHRPGIIIARHRLGYVLANAGIDASNVGRTREHVLLLPEDPNKTCQQLLQAFSDACGASLGVIINDSVGRAWRRGTTSIALGSAGFPALLDLREDLDLDRRPLKVSMVGLADELAAAASLVQGQGNEGRPVVIIKGFDPFNYEVPETELTRPENEDLFR